MIGAARGARGPLAAVIAVWVAAAALAGGCSAPRRVVFGAPPAPPASEPGRATPPPPAEPLADPEPPPFLDLLTSAPLLVRVGLAAGAGPQRLEVPGPALLLDGERKEVGRLAAACRLEFERARAGVRWRGGGAGGEAGAALFVQPVDPGATLAWGGRPYPGEILLLAPRAGGLTVVNVVEMEEYLRGVVPWEIGRPGPEGKAAVAAQAVAARTYTVAHLQEQRALGFDVWADVRDQVYRGAEGRDPGCDAAIAATRGLVLRHEGREIEAYYCSTCGGRTSDVSEVWPREPRPYLRSRPDDAGDGRPFCADSPRFAWRESWTGEQLARILRRTLPEYLDHMGQPGRREWAGPLFTPRDGGADPRRPGALRGLRIVAPTSCGRVARLDVATEAGVYHVRGDRVRWVLAPADGEPAILWSARFALDVTEDGDGRPVRIEAAGRGFGHGVGLCQSGALGMSARGYDVHEILAHYYPGARLEAVAPGR